MPVLLPMTVPTTGGGGGVPDVDTNVRAYGEVDNVAKDTETLILSLTNAGPGDIRLDRITGEGNADAVIRVYIDGDQIDQKRIGISSPNADFVYPRPQLVPVGKEVEVKVFQYEDILAEFSATILGHRI